MSLLMAPTRRQSVTQPDCKAVVCCSVRQKSSSARPRLRGGGSRRSLCCMRRPRRAELDRRAARPAQRGFCQHGGAGVEQVHMFPSQFLIYGSTDETTLASRHDNNERSSIYKNNGSRRRSRSTNTLLPLTLLSITNRHYD